jgi:cysteine desulfurase
MTYFDHNATTPLCAVAEQAWLKANRECWHNASSLYREAGFTAQRLDSARERLADLLGCEAARIVFTSGATEANNALLLHHLRGQRIALSNIEHPSVLAAAGEHAQLIPVNEHGVVELSSVQECLEQWVPQLVSLMAANNESGSLQPWQQTAELCRSHRVRFHTDASQWCGKLPMHQLGECDYITGSAHKFGGPKGVGFLVLAEEEEKLSFLRGGPQEQGRRAGTENYPGIEAMVTALEHHASLSVATEQAAQRDSFEQQMQQRFPQLRIISGQAQRLWNTSLMVMPQHSNLKWLTRLSRKGFPISTGSACSSGKEGSSVVVRALGASEEELRRVVRISSGWYTTAEEWQALAQAFVEVAAEL